MYNGTNVLSPIWYFERYNIVSHRFSSVSFKVQQTERNSFVPEGLIFVHLCTFFKVYIFKIVILRARTNNNNNNKYQKGSITSGLIINLSKNKMVLPFWVQNPNK